MKRNFTITRVVNKNNTKANSKRKNWLPVMLVMLIANCGATAFAQPDANLHDSIEGEKIAKRIYASEKIELTVEQRLELQAYRMKEKIGPIKLFLEVYGYTGQDVQDAVLLYHEDRRASGRTLLSEYENLRTAFARKSGTGKDLSDDELAEKLRHFRTLVQQERERQDKSYQDAKIKLRLSENPRLDLVLTRLSIIGDEQGVVDQTDNFYRLVCRVSKRQTIVRSLETEEECQKYQDELERVTLPFLKRALQSGGYSDKDVPDVVLNFYRNKQEAGVDLFAAYEHVQKELSPGNKDFAASKMASIMDNFHDTIRRERELREADFQKLSKNLDLAHHPRLDYFLMNLGITGDERSIANSTETLSEDDRQMAEMTAIRDSQIQVH